MKYILRLTDKTKLWAICALCIAALLLLRAEAGAEPIEDAAEGSHIWTELIDVGSEPDGDSAVQDIWLSDLPVSVNGLFVGMSTEELGKGVDAGKERLIEDGTFVYEENLIIRIGQRRVVNISAAEDSRYKLMQNGRAFVAVGTKWEDCAKILGDPLAFYTKSDEQDIRIALYSHSSADIGVFLQNGCVGGFLLTEPGMLAESLRWSNYIMEEVNEK